MNLKYITDKEYNSSLSYQNYLKNNSGDGYLMIRANTANEAIPIMGLKVIISRIINNDKVIFFEGETDSSGMIEKIKLPAPLEEKNNLNVPLFATYQMEWSYSNTPTEVFDINIYDKICTVQNIIISPDLPVRGHYGN